MADTTPKPNWFVRGCIVAFLLFLATLAAISFRYGALPFEVTSGILLVLVLMSVALLAESFNSISVGSLLRLQREVTKAESEKKEAKEEVRELRSSLLTLATTFHQSQVTNNISGLDVIALRKALGVVEATPEEIEEDKQESSPRVTGSSVTVEVAKKDEEDSWEFRRALRKVIVDDLVRRFSEKYRIPLLEIRRDVKFESGIENPDPIMSRTMVYHGYVKNEQKEYFLEIGPIQLTSGGIFIGIDDRLYVKLAKIFFYKQIKKTEAEMVYLDAVLPESASNRPGRRPFARVADTFQPAIANNLLRFESITITEEEFNHLKTQTKKKLA
jgi:hypothetical protein